VADQSPGFERRRVGLPRRLRLLLLGDAAERGEIRSVLLAVTEPQLEVREEQLESWRNGTSGDVDVVLFVFNRELRAQVVPAVPAGGEQSPVRIVLIRDHSPQTIREALRSGADEVLFLPLDQGDLARVLLKISESRREVESAAAGKLISIVSITGGAGVTTVAANCALALAHSAGKRVALIDLDLQSGDLAVALNVETERGILDLNDTGMRLNSVQIESALTRHSSGVYLLAAPKRIEESEQIPASSVGLILGMMREMVDVVIVDIGRHIGDGSVAAWERSNQLLYVIDQSIGAMRGALRFLDLFGRLDLASVQPRFVVNRFLPRHPIGEKHIVNTLGRPLLARIPRDDAAMEQALGRGEDLWQAAPRSPLTRAFEALAQQITGPVQRPKSAGLLSKILARNGVNPGVKR
jgi:pilus assembly protein CpaE